MGKNKLQRRNSFDIFFNFFLLEVLFSLYVLGLLFVLILNVQMYVRSNMYYATLLNVFKASSAQLKKIHKLNNNIHTQTFK